MALRRSAKATTGAEICLLSFSKRSDQTYQSFGISTSWTDLLDILSFRIVPACLKCETGFNLNTISQQIILCEQATPGNRTSCAGLFLLKFSFLMWWWRVQSVWDVEAESIRSWSAFVQLPAHALISTCWCLVCYSNLLGFLRTLRECWCVCWWT